MEIVSPAMAEKLLKMLEIGSGTVHQELSDIMNQFINYMIFVEAVGLIKWLLLFVGAAIIARAFKFWELAAGDNESDINAIKGIRNIIVGAVTIVAVFISINSALGLGKILIAPKIYLIEMAIEKVKEVKAANTTEVKK